MRGNHAVKGIVTEGMIAFLGFKINLEENKIMKIKFDVVVIANALHIMPEPDDALKEIYRVLKKDGILFAPTFVYEKGYFKPLIWIMERAGFKTYHKWTRMEYVKYVSQKGFRVIRDILVEGKPLSECVLVAEKSNPV